MNILPKKRWHVRTKENIERVRRDEAKAAEEEKERQRRIALAEQEARTEILRKKAAARHGTAVEGAGNDALASTSSFSDGKAVAIYTADKADKHMNFFQHLEDGKQTSGGNKDYENEKKAEKEKAERAIGLLTYLGESAVEAKESKPWYFTSPDKRMKRDESETNNSKKKSNEFDSKKKSLQDPMRTMAKYMDYKHKSKHQHKNREEDRDKKHKHKHKHKSKDQEIPKVPSASKSIEQLRAERLKREKEERQKTERLMAKLRGEKIPGDPPPVIMDDRQRGYNSVYNPDLVRKRKSHDQHHKHY